MRTDTLRTVLLVKAIEESDRAGEVLPLADRTAATRDAGRSDRELPVSGAGGDSGPDAAPLPAKARRLLVRRASLLRDRLVLRHPFLATVEQLATGPAWLSVGVLVTAFAAGIAMSALDGSHRIDILAFPLLGLLAWNLLVYLWVIAGVVSPRSRRPGPRRGGAFTRFYGWLASRPLKSLLSRAAPFNAPLTEALRRFMHEWGRAAGPRLVARATRLFHLGAATLAIGLVAGLYLRGMVLRYDAGWESTFLGASTVHAIVGALYGPASAVSGVPLPDVETLEKLRWQPGGGGGESAARWIHLISVTAALFIVLPRLALALFETLRAWRQALSASLPPSVVPYFRTVFGGAGSTALGRGLAAVTPYAYEPSAGALAKLSALLPAALGGGVAVEVREAVRYGDEDAFVAHLAERSAGVADTLVLLLNLAATPEDESHGAMLDALRERLHRERGGAQLLVVVDAGPYAARIGADATMATRFDERRAAWRDFVRAHGLPSCIVDLRPLASAASGPGGPLAAHRSTDFGAAGSASTVPAASAGIEAGGGSERAGGQAAVQSNLSSTVAERDAPAVDRAEVEAIRAALWSPDGAA